MLLILLHEIAAETIHSVTHSWHAVITFSLAFNQKRKPTDGKTAAAKAPGEREMETDQYRCLAGAFVH